MQSWRSLKSDLLIRGQFLKKEHKKNNSKNLQAEAFP